MESKSVTIQMKATEHCFPVFIHGARWFSLLRMRMKLKGVTIV